MLHVAVAVIRDSQGRVLLSQRRQGTHLAGLWEFPGGKLDAGESLSDALLREIDEELGITIDSHRPLIQVRHHYPERSVLLDVHLVTSWRGEASGREGQQIAWVAPDRIADYELPPADKPILTALNLPDRYLITPDEAGFDLSRLKDDESLLQLRIPHASSDQLLLLARQVGSSHPSMRLMVKQVELAQQLGCGLHLNSRDLMACRQRPIPQDQLLAASCHDADEIAQAEEIGADFIVLSPVRPTASHPWANPIGWQRFALLTAKANLPVYALGGVGLDDLQTAWQSGAQGIAGISFWLDD